MLQKMGKIGMAGLDLCFCLLKLSYGDSLLTASFWKQTKVLSALT